MLIPISESFISTNFIVDLTSFTSYEKIVVILLANILFYVSFKFFYGIIKDMFRSIVRTIKRFIK